jgi:hypothetical protein
MMVSANRFRSIGWIALLLICGALVMVLAFRVNALRSQVHRTEQQIVALRKEKLYLETEVETRANQQQLKLWNDVEFGYVAPTASQYLSSERQLAAFSKPDEVNAPAPIRVASADNTVAAEAAFPSIVSQLAGEPDISASNEHTTAAPDTRETASAEDHATAAAGLGARLATVGPARQTSSAAPVKAALARPVSAQSKADHADHPGKGGKLAASPKSGKAAALGTVKSAKPVTKSTAKPAKTSRTAP